MSNDERQTDRTPGSDRLFEKACRWALSQLSEQGLRLLAIRFEASARRSELSDRGDDAKADPVTDWLSKREAELEWSVDQAELQLAAGYFLATTGTENWALSQSMLANAITLYEKLKQEGRQG